MFVRKLQNRSGSYSVQIISKSTGKYRVVKTIGSSRNEQELQRLEHLAKQEIGKLASQGELFLNERDTAVESVISHLSNASIRTIGPELIFGSIFDRIGFSSIKEELFRHLVIARLTYPLSKLKTVDYIFRYQGVKIDINAVYRFLDKLDSKLKSQVEQITYKHTMKVLKGEIGIVFYDMTTLYFEASDEDDLRKTGFSKDGKHQNPQIFLGLLVGLGGYAIGYDIFEGDIFEGHTLIPFIEKMSDKFNFGLPVIVADAGLLSNDNIISLEQKGYEYIIGARLKNETNDIKEQILEKEVQEGKCVRIKKPEGRRLVITYSSKRASKDEYNRTRGLQRLEKNIKSGKLTKDNINNRGYNKYLQLKGEVEVKIDYEKFDKDKAWDGLKGYITNASMKDELIIENYNNLWHIERAFRMSKTDLRIRPIYHRLRKRIEAHICISFTAYAIYKELERILHLNKSVISVKRAAELTHTIYQISYTLPESKQTKTVNLKMDEEQVELWRLVTDDF